MNELEKLSRPLIRYLEKNYNPHTKIEITKNGIKVLTEEISIPNIDNKQKKYELTYDYKLGDKRLVITNSEAIYNQIENKKLFKAPSIIDDRNFIFLVN